MSSLRESCCRLERLSGGRLAYRMKTPWRSGQTHVVISWCETHKCVRQHDSQRLTASPAHCRFRKTLCPAKILRASITESALMRHQTRQQILALPHLKLLRSYPFHAILCRADRGHFPSIGGSCHEEEESPGSSDVVDFRSVARQRVHYRAGPEFWSSSSDGDEVV